MILSNNRKKLINKIIHQSVLIFISILLFPFLSPKSFFANSQNIRVNFSSNSSTSKEEKGKLIIQINNIRNNSGKIIFHLFNNETGKYFPTKSDKSSLRIDTKIEKNQARIIIEDLPYGSYAYTIHHDENDNKKMDKTFLGFPDEGWALSNEIKPVFSLPDYDEGKFQFNKPELEITTSLNY